MPSIDWSLLAPHLVLTGFALVVLLMAAVKGEKPGPQPSAGWVAAIGCAVTVVLCATNPNWGSLWGSMFVWDPASAFFGGMFAVAAGLVAIGSAGGGARGEYYFLILVATVGLMFMVASGNLLMLYLSLEVSTISLFVLAGYDRHRDRSAEASLKYLITAGIASAVFLFGVSWVYGAVGSTDFEALATAYWKQVPAYAWIGMFLVLIGLGFKIAAAPFHLWAPDVYEGSPSPVSAFLSTASKAAGFLAICRLLLIAMPHSAEVWLGFVIALAVLSMTFGNLVAIVQNNVKRLLAYSGVAQAGFILIAVASASKQGMGAIGLYLAIYVFANVGAFLCVYAVGEKADTHGMDAYNGLSRRSPMLAFAMLIFLLSLAGIPPLAGFVGKFLLFAAGMKADLWGLVLFGAIASTVSLYYYLLVAKRMYISDPDEGAQKLPVSKPLSWAIALCVLMTAVIGIYPAPWVALSDHIGSFVR